MTKSNQKNRRTVGTKKTTRRKSTKVAVSKPDLAALKRRSQPATLEDWLGRVRGVAANADATKKPKGACFVPDPAGGPAMCLFVDRDTCKIVKGTFLGGPC